MTDETRPDTGDNTPDTPETEKATGQDVSAGQDTDPDPTEPDTDPDNLPALDADDNPDSLVGDLTDPDVDVDLVTEPDEDGGDEE